MLRKASLASKEKSVFDKKADEATIELIVAKEELEAVRDEKKKVEKSIEEIKSELVKFMKTTTRTSQQNQHAPHGPVIFGDDYFFYESGRDVGGGGGGGGEVRRRSSSLSTIVDEQTRVLKALNSEIESKKREIDDLREKSQRFADELKSETSSYQSDVNALKAQKEHLSGQLKVLRTKIDEGSLELDERARQLEATSVELSRLVSTREKETKSLKDVEANLSEKK